MGERTAGVESASLLSVLSSSIFFRFYPGDVAASRKLRPMVTLPISESTFPLKLPGWLLPSVL